MNQSAQEQLRQEIEFLQEKKQKTKQVMTKNWDE